jgi:hypothetical protein
MHQFLLIFLLGLNYTAVISDVNFEGPAFELHDISTFCEEFPSRTYILMYTYLITVPAVQMINLNIAKFV